jgi:putative hemolysin
MALVLLAAAALAGCATQARQGERDVGDAVQQPMRDLSLIRDMAPPSLTQAAVAPYAAPAAVNCAALRGQLVELDTALGPDVDTPAESSDTMSGLAGDLVRGALGLPFRGIVRRVTGAEQRDAAYRRAVLAGMVRRGYLKGRLAEISCPPPLATPAA